MQELEAKYESNSFGRLGVYFFAPIAALVLLGILTFVSIQNIRQCEKRTVKAQEAIAVAQDLQTSLLNAETGQRGFLLSNNQNYLEPYFAARGAIENETRRLRESLAELEISLNLEELEALIRKRLDHFSSTIKLQSEGKIDEIKDFIAGGVGKQTMDEIRRMIHQIESTLRKKMSESDDQAWRSYFNAFGMFSMALLIALFTISWSLLRFDRELQKRKLGESVIRQRSAQLQSLADILARIVSAKDTDSVVGIALNEFRQLIGAREALLQLKSQGHDKIVRGIVAAGVQEPSEEYLACIFDLVNRLSRGEASFYRRREQLLANCEITQTHAWSVCNEAMDGLLTAPIRDGQGHEVGRIVLLGKFGDEFNENDVNIASQLAFTASVAIENARLNAQSNREAERKDEFLAMLGHELRNPLAGILAGSEALIENQDPSVTLSIQQSIHRQSVLMSKIVDDLLDVSRIGQGKISLSRIAFDIVEMVGQVVEDYRRAHANRKFTVKRPLKDEPIWVYGDRARLVQCLTNLIHNACKFSDEDQPVTVGVFVPPEQPKQVKIAVTDLGIGLDSREIEEIFQMFHQSYVTIDRAQGGLGIGLTLAKGLVEMHRGSLKVESRGRGTGSTFTISLPIAHRVPDTTDKPAEGISVRGPTSPAVESVESCRVLVIDDRMDVILPIRVLLTNDGHRVAEAYDGKTGLERAKEFKPTVVFCDIGLPGGMSGYEVAQAIRSDESLRMTYLVALSGYSQPQDQERSRLAGFDFHVAKPIDHKTLRHVISQRPTYGM